MTNPLPQYRRSPAVGQSHIERQTLALEQIAENTKPKDDEITEVSINRDKYRLLLKGAVGFIEGNADALMVAMEEPDMMQRGIQIRNVIQKMLDFVASYKRDDQ